MSHLLVGQGEGSLGHIRSPGGLLLVSSGEQSKNYRVSPPKGRSTSTSTFGIWDSLGPFTVLFKEVDPDEVIKLMFVSDSRRAWW